MVHDAVTALLQFLDRFRAPSPRPILWVGADANLAAWGPAMLASLDATPSG